MQNGGLISNQMPQLTQNSLVQNTGLVSNNNFVSNNALTSIQNNQQPLILPVQQAIPQPVPIQQNQAQPQFYQPQPQIVQNNQSPQISAIISSPSSNTQKDPNCRFFD